MNISKTNKIILALLTFALLIALISRFALQEKVPQQQNESEATEPVAYNDLIKVSSPLPNARIGSPVTITGEARGQWFFEASFPVLVMDKNGLIIGEGFAEATGDWMTQEYVPFVATVTFDADTTVSDKGSIILKKSNASGMPEHDDSFKFPITFTSATAEASTPTQGTNATTLAGTSWEWIKSVRAEDEGTIPPAGKFILTFDEDGTASSATDCNSMSGPYVVNGEVLSFGAMMSTLMFCDGSVETYYANYLALVNSYVIDGTEMRLNLNRDAGTMYFKKR